MRPSPPSLGADGGETRVTTHGPTPASASQGNREVNDDVRAKMSRTGKSREQILGNNAQEEKGGGLFGTALLCAIQIINH